MSTSPAGGSEKSDIKISVEPEDLKSQISLHSIPAQIEFSGPNPVSQHFTRGIKDLEGDLKGATFRGRPLVGSDLSLPHGYKFVTLTENDSSLQSDGMERTLKVLGSSDSAMWWNLDEKPSEFDLIQRTKDIMHIAKALHGTDD